MNDTPEPEYSRRVSLSELTNGPRDYKIEVPADAYPALCERLELQGLHNFKGTAHLTLSPHAPLGIEGPCIELQGTLGAQVTQTCVVTLEPVDNLIEAEFSGVFVRDADNIGITDSEDEEEDQGPDILGEIIPDIVDSIDLGEFFVQQLALELDPFPRKEGADINAYTIESKEKITDEENEERKNPFDVLKKLKKNMD